MTCVGSSRKFLAVFLVSSIFMATAAHAEEVIFAEDELPQEVVTPRLDTPKAVLSRKLSYQSRWQADILGGWLLDEAFYNNQYVGIQATYSWSEASGLGVKYLSFGSGLSDYSNQFGSISTNPPDFTAAKGPSTGWIASYERRMMYGKVSLSKRNVIPALLTWNIEAGMLKYGSKQLPLAGASVGNRFFPTQHFGISLALHAYVRQLVDPLSADIRAVPVPAEGDFSTSTKFSTALDLSLTYLF